MPFVRPSQVPQYLREGELYKSLDVLNDDELEVPNDALKSDLECRSVNDINNAFTSLRYWIVPEIPYELIDFLLTHKDVAVDEQFTGSFPDITLIKNMKQTKSEEDRFKQVVTAASLHVMNYMLDRGFKVKNPTNMCIVAARAGKLEMLKYFHQLGAKLHIITVKASFISGSRDCLDYLKEHNAMHVVQGKHICIQGSFYPDPDAVFVPDLPTLLYAVEQGCVMTERLPYTAAELGRLHILTYAHEQGCVWDNTTTTRAAECGQLPCLQYAVEHGCPLNGLAQSKAAEHGHLHCMEYLHRVGCPWGEDTFFYAAAYNHLECLKFAHEHGCPVVKGVYRIARIKKLHDIVAYLEQHNITVEDVNNEFPPMDALQLTRCINR